MSRYALRFGALGYLARCCSAAGRDGLLPHVRARASARAWDAVTTPEALHAFWLTLMIARDRRAR